jgi:acetyl/propionyl-CoA carboxylase alpha subunit
LQVEHPVTELVTGLDLVREMLRIAAGERIAETIPERRGAAIEARLYAEDPADGFLPSPGTLELLREPGGPFVRVDSGVEQGSSVGPEYDPLLAKLAVWAPDRPQALRRLRRALGEYVVSGIETNLGLLLALVENAAFERGDYDTSFIERNPELCRRPVLDAGARDELTLALSALALLERGSEERPAPAGGETSAWVLAERPRWGVR